VSDKVRPCEGGVRIAVRLTPKGGRDAIDGWFEHGGKPVLKARVSAPPEDGKANKALIALLSKVLRTPKSAVRIASGETSRIKMVDIEGDVSLLSACLEALGEIA
jgi:uncharacterized protein (TIGR00251 family)